jgi:hypothetical protein
MGLFKGLPDKPYTKAEYYREMEERHAAKIAAKAAPVVVVPVRDPEWLEPAEEPVSLEVVEETVVVPFVEPEPSVAESEPVVEQPKAIEVAPEVPVEPPPEAKKVTKTKRKKS